MFIRHGLHKSRLYHIWANMKYRCSAKDKCHREDYKERGIKVCKEWEEFLPFYQWATTHGYKDGLTIDRKDNDKGYAPTNCRWVDIKKQNNNKRDNTILVYDGQSKTVSEWAEELGLSKTALYKRLAEYGWDVKRALTTPVRKKRLKEPTMCIKNGMVIATYESASEAARFVDGRPAGVIMCCNGKRRTYRGYSWRYVNGTV